MRYEVIWMTYELDWDTNIQEQVFTAEQFDTLERALFVFESKKKDIDVENVRIVVILDEFSVV
jgi:hypothetical protein